MTYSITTTNNACPLNKIERFDRSINTEFYEVLDKFYFKSVLKLINKHKYIHIKKNYQVKYSVQLDLPEPYQSTKIMIYDDGATHFYDEESKKNVVSMQLIFTIDSDGIQEGSTPFSGIGYMYYRRNVNSETLRYEGFNYAANWSENIPEEVIFSDHYRYYINEIKSRIDKIFKGYIMRHEDDFKNDFLKTQKMKFRTYNKKIFFGEEKNKVVLHSELNNTQKSSNIFQNFISLEEDDDFDFDEISSKLLQA